MSSRNVRFLIARTTLELAAAPGYWSVPLGPATGGVADLVAELWWGSTVAQEGFASLVGVVALVEGC